MLVSLNWLNERLDLSGKTPQDLDDLLTFAGIEVEGIQSQGPTTDLVVVAEVKSAEQHPDADRLKVCQVDTGDGSPRQIVCGAQNYKVGDRVPCALPGAELPGGFNIKVGKLRGVESAGMLCGADEIGYPAVEDGLMILAADAPLGKPVREVLGADTIFEVEITPNRPDLLSHSGMARELAALLEQSTEVKTDWKPVEISEPAASGSASVDIKLDAEAACPFYSALKITGVKVADSPAWLKEKLQAIGLRPINNIVDITNYVLHELGQPLHAFDAAKVTTPLHIRMAKDGEEFVALDEETYALEASDVVISDKSGAVLALGGVMGGLSSGTTESTTDVILESAYFHTSTIRRTSRRLMLSSDSSYRFERGVDPGGVLPAAYLAAKLIGELAGGKIDETFAQAGTLPLDRPTIAFDEAGLRRVAGDAVSWDRAKKILNGLAITEASPNVWTVPSYRGDLIRDVDLIEEVVRVFGLDNFPSLHATTLIPPSDQDAFYDLELKLKQRLAALGFFEAQTIKLIGESQLSDALPLRPLQDGDVIRVARPLSEDHAVLRPSMTPGLLAVASVNARQLNKSLRFFETGTVFRNSGGGKATDIESQGLGLIVSGLRAPTRWDESGKQHCDLFDLKAAVQSLLPRGVVEFASRDREGFLLGCDIKLDGKNIGVAAMVMPGRATALDIDSSVFVAELDLKKVLAATDVGTAIRELPQFPGSSRDMAIEAPLELTSAEIEKAVHKVKEPLLVNCVCFDVFTDPSGKKLNADKKSMAYSLTYRSEKQTLTNDEVSAAHDRILKALTDSLPISFR